MPVSWWAGFLGWLLSRWPRAKLPRPGLEERARPLAAPADVSSLGPEFFLHPITCLPVLPSPLHPPASVPCGWARGGAKDSSGTCSVGQWEGDTSCDWGPGLLAPSQLDRAHTKEAVLTPCQSSTHPASSPSQAHPITEEVCVGAWETCGARYTEPPWEVRGSHLSSQSTPRDPD